MIDFSGFILGGEGNRVEYKEKYSKSILKTVSAFANYQDGIIVIGIADSGLVVGLDDPQRVRLDIENAINDVLKPRPYFEVVTQVVEHKTVLVFKVFKGEFTPYTVEKKAYRRSDTSTVEVQKHEYDELVLYGRNQTYEELPCNQEVLHFNKLRGWLDERLNISDLSEDVLKSFELIKTGKYTNAAALFADKNRFDALGFDLICYQDDQMTQIKDRMSLSGVSIIEHFEKSMLFYEKHVNRSEVIRAAAREVVEEFPFIAYREAIANAIVHRDYSRSGHNRIEFFSDRIEIVSIGSLPLGITEEEFLRGSFSNARNRIIADVFLRCRYIEKMGTGIRRIKNAYGQSPVKPVFEVHQNSITIVLPKVQHLAFQYPHGGLAPSSPGEVKDVPVVHGLSLEEEKALGYVKSGHGASRLDIETHLHVKKTKASQILASLKDKGLIMTIGKGRDTRYK